MTPPELQPVLFARPEVARHLGKSYVMEPVHFKSTPVMITALAAGEIDIAPFTFASFGTAIVNAGMQDLRIIADEFQDGVEGYFTEPYLVRRDSGIHAVEDLKGKVIATNGIGSGVDMAMRAMLRRHHLEDKRDYSVVEVQFPNMKAVLMERKVDLICVPAAFAYDPELEKTARVLFTQRDALGPTQFALWTARTPFLEKNRAAVVDFLEDTLRALRWYLEPANHAAAVDILADFTHLPAARFDGWLLTHKDQYRDPAGLAQPRGIADQPRHPARAGIPQDDGRGRQLRRSESDQGSRRAAPLAQIPLSWNKSSLRAERSNPVASDVPFALDCFVGDASSQ